MCENVTHVLYVQLYNCKVGDTYIHTLYIIGLSNDRILRTTMQCVYHDTIILYTRQVSSMIPWPDQQSRKW